MRQPILKTFFVLAIISGVGFFFSWCINDRRSKQDADDLRIMRAHSDELAVSRNAPLSSVLRREADVFGSNKFGIFRANLKSQRWIRIDVPDILPLGGKFGTVPNQSNIILYVVSQRFDSSADNQKYGIYVSRDDGEIWSLVSEHHDYGSVLLLSNGSLFAVTNPENINGPSRLHVSQDMGKTWRDITGASFGGIFGLFSHPDDCNKICLHVDSIRGYILQAEDEQYLWKSTRTTDWEAERALTTDFFSQRYSTSTGPLYMLAATLNNYFQYGFGEHTQMRSFDLSADKSSTIIRQGTAVVVPVTIRFREDMAFRNWLCEERKLKGHSDPRPTPTTVKLIDNSSNYGLWGIRVDFNGQRSSSGLKIGSIVYGAEDRDAIRRKLRRETAWNDIQITMSKPYHKQFDLAQMYNFTRPGTYKVQLIYNSSALADRDKGHWGGSFSSSVFSVVVTAPE